MKFEEENHARDLHRELKANGPRGAKLNLHGSGNQWTCAATQRHRTCSISCHHQAGEPPGPEFVLAFQQYNLETAACRVYAVGDAVAAATCWLDGHPIEILHKRFDFVDGPQRALRAMEKTLLAQCPELETATTHELRRIVHEIYYLWFVAKDRACRISFAGKNAQPDALFYADGTELFHFPVTGADELTPVLRAWLCENALLTRIHAAFPEIPISDQALEYERHAIEGKFLQRWNTVTHFFQHGTFPHAAEILALVSEMRWAGYDRKFNAVPAETQLVVARLRGGMIVAETPSALFSFHDGGMEVYSEGQERVRLSEIKFTPEVDALLKELAARELY